MLHEGYFHNQVKDNFHSRLAMCIHALYCNKITSLIPLSLKVFFLLQLRHLIGLFAPGNVSNTVSSGLNIS